MIESPTKESIKTRCFHRLKKDVGMKVLEKYKYQCTQCCSSNDLCVHHVQKMTPDDPNYNDIENLTILCRSCHMKIHRKNKDINPEGYLFKKGIINNPNGRRGKKEKVYCRVSGCSKQQHAKSLCKNHYERFRLRGGIIN